MVYEICMPALSPTMSEGKLVKWLKKEGDTIELGDGLVEIETDKSVMELESIEEGKLAKIIYQGDSDTLVPINTVIALISTDEDTDEDIANMLKKATSTADNTKASEPEKNKNTEPEITTAKSEEPLPEKTNSALATDQRIKASPLAKKLAQDKNISLNEVEGSGPYGRVIKQDLTNMSAAADTNIALPKSKEKTQIPVSGMRKVIAERLQASKRDIPHFYINASCSMDKLMNLRAEINAETDTKNTPEAKPNKISINDFIIKAVAMSLKEVPEMNVSWHDTYMAQHHSSDISVAVAIQDGLITPIVTQAENKTLSTISREVKSLVAKAKSNTLKPNEYQGGSFTISNLGMYKIKNFSAILNPPQSGILAVGGIIKQPTVTSSNEIKITSIMEVTLSVDHRAIDGAVAAQFLNKFCEFIQNPAKMLI